MSVKASDFRLEESNTWCTIGRAIEILKEGNYKGDIYIGTTSGEGFQYIGPPDAEKIAKCYHDIWQEKRKLLEDKYYDLLWNKIHNIHDILVFPALYDESDKFLDIVYYANDLKKLSSATYNLTRFFENYVNILDRPIVKPVRKRIQDDCPIFIVDGSEREGSWYKDEPKKYHRV